jgi:hypothetical protein
MAVGVRLVLAPSAVRPRTWHPSRSKASPWDDSVFGLLWEQLTSAPVQMALASALTACWPVEASDTTRRRLNHSVVWRHSAPRTMQRQAARRQTSHDIALRRAGAPVLR